MIMISILESILDGKRLCAEDALLLLQSREIALLGEYADRKTRQLHPGNDRTYNVERNINYTNGCISGCEFCAFCRKEEDEDHYILTREELFRKIEETLRLGGNQILLQGGLHPKLPFSWYLDMLRAIRERFPEINVHGFSPTEIVFFSEKFSLPIPTVLEELRGAGLGSLPGGGAEILVDRVRSKVSPKKASAEQWLNVCKCWHEMGGRGSATMMFGHLETPTERIEHLRRIRELQDQTGGFTAFIPWTFQPGRTRLSHLRKLGSWEYLKTLAVARLFLDNIPNLQASWVTQGMRIGPLSLLFGANDLGSIMIEENVVAAAGTVFKTDEEQVRNAIHSYGFTPKRRDVFYRNLP